jgi:hypothetical protein
MTGKIKSFFWRYKYLTISILCLAILTTFPAYAFFGWSSTQDKISVKVYGPSESFKARVNNRLPDPLRIRFGKSVVNLSLMGKVIKDGIKMSPPLKGDWKWVGDRRLKFQPLKPWAADEEYTIRLSDKLFADYVRLRTYKLSFKTAKFKGKIEELKLHQDPKNPKVHKVVATIAFTYPVDTKNMEKNISLSGGGHEYKKIITFGPNMQKIFVHSEPVQILDSSYHIKLEVDDNIKTPHGGVDLDSSLDSKVRIPEFSSFFKLRDTSTRIVENPKKQNIPEQILFLDFTTGVSKVDLMNHLDVYVLPSYNPIQGDKNSERNNRQSRMYHWSNVKEVTDDVLSKSKKLSLVHLEQGSENTGLHSFRYDIPEVKNRYLYVRVKKGLQSESGFALDDTVKKILSVPKYTKEVKITLDGALLTTKGEQKLSFLSRGVKGLEIEIGRLMPGQINHLITQTKGNFINPNFREKYTFNENNIVEKFKETRVINVYHPQKAVYSSVNLSRYTKNRQGIYFVKVRAWNPETKNTTSPSDSRLIIVSDMGLLVKDNADKTHDLFVVSIKGGYPVSNAKVEVLGQNGLAVLTRYTDGNGHASLPNLDDFEDDKKPVAYLVTKGRDLSFLPVSQSDRRINYSRFKIGGEHTTNSNDSFKNLKSYVFTDRGIYRPGEKINFAGIVRQKSWGALGHIPLEMVIEDPRGKKVFNKKFTLSSVGLFEASFSLEESAATGKYNVQVFLIRDDDKSKNNIMLGSASFKVEEFQADRMKIKTKIIGKTHKGWMTPDNLKGRVKLENLFGTPAEKRKVKANIVVSPQAFYFDVYKQFKFMDPLKKKKNALKKLSESLPEINTDKDGVALFDFNLDRFDKGTYNLTFSAEGFETSGGRSVSSVSSSLVSPLSSLVGYKVDGDLEYIKKNATRNISFIAIDQDLKKISLSGLMMKIIEKRYVSSLVKQSNGTYKYQSVVKEVPLSARTFSVSKLESSYKLFTKNPGNFYIKLVDKDKNIVAHVDYSVAGKSNLTHSLERNAELKLKLNKKKYRPGEAIEMHIVAPYKGAGLITIERDKVYAMKWFNTSETSSVQNINVPSSFEGNGYVNVSFIRSSKSREIFLSPHSYAVAPFSIDNEKRSLKLSLNVPKKVMPGDKLKINYKTSKPSKIIVFAVNEGILQVAGYKTPDPLSFFFNKKALGVRTSQIVDLILPEYRIVREVAASGGGAPKIGAKMMAPLLGSNLNPFKRKMEKPAVFWSGIIDAGPGWKVTNFNIPSSFNGQLRVMAVAVNQNAIGVNENKLISKAPLILSPNVPVHAAPGDIFEVNVGISNNVDGSGLDAKIEVNMKSSKELQVIGESRKVVAVGESSEDKISFKVKVLNKLGAGSLKFNAQVVNKPLKKPIEVLSTLSIRPAIPYRTTLISGVENNSDVMIDKLERKLYSEYATQEAVASTSPLLLMRGLADFLKKFPHGCSEQLTSKVFPFVSLARHGDKFVKRSDVEKSFKNTIKQLMSRQTPSGGFSMWSSNGGVASKFVSIYVTHFLTIAKEAGYNVPSSMHASAIRWLERMVKKGVSSKIEARRKAYALYVLTLNSHVTTNELIRMEEYLEKNYEDKWKTDLTGVYMAATYKLLKDDKKAAVLIDGYQFEKNDGLFSIFLGTDSDFENTLSDDAQYLYMLAKHFPNKFKGLEYKSLLKLVKPINEGRFNTLSSSYTVLALSAYQNRVKNENISISQKDKDGKERALSVVNKPFPMAKFSNDAKEITFKSASAGELGLFYLVTKQGFDLEMPKKIIKENLEISREYTNKKGDVITQARVGEEVNVTIRIRAVGDKKHINNVAVIDLLPGGFEIKRSSALLSSGNFDHHELREDRALFYTNVGTTVKEITYKAKVTANGEFVIPPVFASAMYDRKTQAQGLSGRFKVKGSGK